MEAAGAVVAAAEVATAVGLTGAVATAADTNKMCKRKKRKGKRNHKTNYLVQWEASDHLKPGLRVQVQVQRG